MDALRQAQETGLANLATKADLELLRAALKADIEAACRDAKADTEKLAADVRTMNADLRGEIARSKNSMLMWLLPVLLGQNGAMVFLLLKMP